MDEVKSLVIMVLGALLLMGALAGGSMYRDYSENVAAMQNGYEQRVEGDCILWKKVSP